MEPTTYSNAADHRVPSPVTNQALLVGLVYALAIPAVIVAISYPVIVPAVAAFVLGAAARRVPAAVGAMWTHAATRLIARGRRLGPNRLRG